VTPFRWRTVVVVVVVALAAAVALDYILVWITQPEPGPGPSNPAVQLESVQTGLAWPIALAFASDGRVFYAERYTGTIRIIEAGIVLPTPFYTLTNTDTSGERGLLGLALDPGFPASPWVYAYQTFDDSVNGTVYNRIVRIRANGDVGTSDSVILTMPDLTGGVVHNGGVIAFGPDGKLYAVVGENTYASLAQSGMSLLGKVLRMNPDGSPPSDNPFYGSGSWENLVYTYGHRNMFGVAFHPVTGDAYVTENGPDCNDEVNHLEAGRNYGWGPTGSCGNPPSPADTNRDGPSPVMPIASYSPTFAPTNVAFYTGSLLPESQNDLIFGAWDGIQNDHGLRDLRLTADGTAVVSQTILVTATEGILDVEMGPDGYLWVTTQSTIQRLVAANATSTDAVAFPALLLGPTLSVVPESRPSAFWRKL